MTGADARKIKIGRITGAQGLRGEVRLYHDSGDEEALRRLTSLFLRTPDGEAAFRIENIRMQKRTPILRLSGVEDRGAAEALTGAEAFSLYEESRPDAAVGWLVSELAGLPVLPAESKNEALGRVLGVIDNPAHDIMEIETANGTRLLPMVDAFVKEINITDGYVIIDPPEGWASQT